MKHPYLHDSICAGRLLDEYIKYGSLVVAYDFDNTVYDYHSKGHDYSEIVSIIRECAELGFYLIVFTAEENLEKVSSFLKANDIPYSSINENPPFFKSKSGKVYFNTLLDDRAGLKSAYDQLTKVIKTIHEKNIKPK
jgi:hydroxymethylpyrimidine pyrophosphatase-like HAD family hydrolase